MVSIKVFRLLQIATSNKKFYRNANILNELFRSLSIFDMGKSLDIGSGPIPKNPFNVTSIYGVDLREEKDNNVVKGDFGLGYLPFENNYFEYITAFDVLEHIPRVCIVNDKTIYPFINIMNEIFRVIKYNGIFFNIQPCFPSKEVFQDPTHVNIMSEDTIYQYFCDPSWARIYGYEGSFKMVSDGWIGSHYFSFLRKSCEKPIKNLNYIQR